MLPKRVVKSTLIGVVLAGILVWFGLTYLPKPDPMTSDELLASFGNPVCRVSRYEVGKANLDGPHLLSAKQLELSGLVREDMTEPDGDLYWIYTDHEEARLHIGTFSWGEHQDASGPMLYALSTKAKFNIYHVKNGIARNDKEIHISFLELRR